MLIASIGKSISPIQSILEQIEPYELVLIRYSHNEEENLCDEVHSISPNTEVSFHVLDPPTEGSLASANVILYDLYQFLQAITYRSRNAVVCVTGGTPWLSHTLHHAATMAQLPVVVSTYHKIEGSELIFFYPKPLKVVEMKSTLMVGHQPRVQLLQKLAEGPAVIKELAEHLSLNQETVRFMIQGRERGTQSSEPLVISGLEGIEDPLVRTRGKRVTGKKGPQPYEYELTEFGKDVVTLLKGDS